MYNGQLMEFLRGRLLVPTGPTLNKEIIALPSSKTELMAVLLHDIWFQAKYVDPSLKAGDMMYSTEYSISTREPPASNVFHYNEEGCLMFYYRGRSYTESALSNTEGMQFEGQRQMHFDPPVLIAQDYLWVAGMSNKAVMLESTAYYMLGYTIDKVSREAFIAALVR